MKFITNLEEAKFRIGCSEGKLQDIEKFFQLCDNDQIANNELQKEIKIGLNLAAQNGQIEVVKYLIKQEKVNVDLSQDGFEPFVLACMSGEKQMVEYLLSSAPELILYEKINDYLNRGFLAATKENQNDIVIYLLTKIGKKADLHCNQNEAIKTACNNKNTDLIEFFLFELNMSVGEELKTWLRQWSHTKILKMIESRDFKNQLNQSLEMKLNISKTNKV